MAFPASPSNNQVHKEGDKTFVYDTALGGGSVGVWDQVKEANPQETGSITNTTLSSGVTFPAGHVLQVVSTTLRTVTSITGAAFAEITGLTAAITPTSASSKILVNVYFGRIAPNLTSGTTIAIRLMRGATVVGAGTSTGSQLATSFVATSNPNANYNTGGLSTQFFDNPNTISPITYSVQAWGEGNVLVYFNRSYVGGTGTNVYQSASASTITLMEIAG
jgi:hypothetical protein